MSQILSYRNPAKDNQRIAGAVSTSLVIVGFLLFLLGFAAGAFWIHHNAPGPADVTTREASASAQPGLSEGTVVVLGRLRSPVQLTFYSMLDSGAPDELKAFSSRVDQLLAAYETAARGKLTLSRCTTLSYTNANLAVRDGIKPFNLGTGEDCFLGLAVRSKDRHEALPHLSPQWEAALEIDITRAIAEAASPTHAPGAIPPGPKNDAPSVAELKRLIPNLDSVSVADGTRVLREAALKEFGEAAKDSQGQLQEAQQRLAQARNGGSAADQQEAMKHLQEVQSAQSKRLQEIAARSQSQIEALRRLKEAGE